MYQYRSSTHKTNWIYNISELKKKRISIFRKALENSIRIKWEMEGNYQLYPNIPQIEHDIPKIHHYINGEKNNLTPFSEVSSFINCLDIKTPEKKKLNILHYETNISSPLRQLVIVENRNSKNEMESQINSKLNGDTIQIDEQKQLINYYITKIIQICYKCFEECHEVIDRCHTSLILDDNYHMVLNPHNHGSLTTNYLDNRNTSGQNNLSDILSLKYHTFVYKAVIYFKRFYLELNLIEFDIIYAIYGSIFLASKMEDLNLSPLILTKFITTELPNQLSGLCKLSEATNETLCYIETKILEVIKFHLVIYQPYDNILNMLDMVKIDNQMKAMIKCQSLDFCIKILYTDYFFIYDPIDIAFCIVRKVINDNNLDHNLINKIRENIDYCEVTEVKYPEIIEIDEKISNSLIDKYKSSLSSLLDQNYINFKKNQKDVERSVKRKRISIEPETSVYVSEDRNSDEEIFSFKKKCLSDESDDEYFQSIAIRHGFSP